MKKGIFPSVAFLVLFIMFSGCGKKDEPQRQPDQQSPTKRTAAAKLIAYKQFFELTSGVKTNLNAISYFNSARGIVVGDQGTILFTRNGGHDWQAAGRDIPVNLYGAAMVDSLIAVAVGEKGTILRSKDGGKTWYPVKSGNIQFSKTLRAVGFYSGTEGYAVGDSGVIFITPDAGEKWIKVYGDTSKTLNAISFNKTNMPCIVGVKGAFGHSTDHGASWKFASGITRANLRSIHFFGSHSHPDIGFAVGDKGNIFKTTNGGKNWTAQTSPVKKNLRGVFLCSSMLGYAVGDTGTLLRYDGTKWEPLPSPTTKRINAVDPVYWNPSSTCVGEDGLMMFINPPSVNDNGTTATIEGREGCIWVVTLNTKDLVGKDLLSGRPINYRKIEVCSSIEQSDFRVIPGSGWAVREQFRNLSHDLEPNQEYPSQGHPLDSLTLLLNPNSDVTSGYFSCYLKDDNENFYLLSTYEIQCSP